MDYEGFEALIEAIGDKERNTAAEIRALLRHIIPALHLPGDIKIVYCTQEELVTDYTATGLGIGKRAGWAKCNGLNGTRPLNGRVIIGQGDTYPKIGAEGGEEEHKLLLSEIPSHSHTVPARNGSGSIGGAEFPNGGGTTVATSSAGGGLAHNNMQPYTVMLFIQKL